MKGKNALAAGMLTALATAILLPVFPAPVGAQVSHTSLVSLVTGFAGERLASPSVASSQTGGPTARPDLTISLSDLPTGYEEAPSLDLTLFDTPLDDRVFRRAASDDGPEWIWSMTYEVVNPVSAGRLVILGQDLIVFLTRSFADLVQLSEWTQEDPTGLGDVAQAYSFKFRVLATDAAGDGALALFGGGGYLSLVAALDVDGEAVSDLRLLASYVNERVALDQSAMHSTP